MHRSLALLALGAAALAGCGSSPSSTASSTPAPTSAKPVAATAPAASAAKPTGFTKTVELVSNGTSLSPAKLRIAKPGQITIKFTNKGKQPEALELIGPGVDEESGVVSDGKATSLEVLLPKGTFKLQDGLPSGPTLAGSLTVG